MKSDERAGYVTRDAILKLLSDAEVGSVSTAETAPSLRRATNSSTSRDWSTACRPRAPSRFAWDACCRAKRCMPTRGTRSSRNSRRREADMSAR